MADFPHKQLLIDYFEGKCTALQKQWLADWLKDPANQADYFYFLNEWESLHPQYQTDVAKAFDRFKDSVAAYSQQEVNGSVELQKTKLTWITGWSWRLAASVLILLMVGGYFAKDFVQYETYATQFGETRSFLLGDGTLVALNANSTLRVPRWGFGTSDRKVRLDGEAEFKVSHLPGNQKFVVKTNTDFAVEVLGTEFVMYARKSRRKVILSEGKVKVTYLPGKEYTMKPGDWVDLQATGKLLKKRTNKPARFSSWKQHRFTFDNTSLSEIGLLIQEHFGLTVIIDDPELARRTVSGVFEAQKSNDLVDALADLLHLEARQTSKGLVLSQPQKFPKSK